MNKIKTEFSNVLIGDRFLLNDKWYSKIDKYSVEEIYYNSVNGKFNLKPKTIVEVNKDV